MAAPVQNDSFLRACRRQPVDRVPVWLMRQAGRYMAEYRALREKHTILELIHSPELSRDVTLQPIQAFDLDAAIIFSDILPVLVAMGLDLEFIKGQGPVIHNPIGSAADVERLRPVHAEQDLHFTLDAITCSLESLNGRIPLIGFSGAPFTLACYAIEGRGSRDFAGARRFMHAQPEAFAALMDKLTDAVTGYLVAQVHRGVHAVQLFDSWAGVLSPSDYRRVVLPRARKILAAVKAADPDVPVIHFATGSAGILEEVRDAGADVVGVDWRIDIDRARARLGDTVATQGNLDPLHLLGPREPLLRAAADVLDRAALFNDGRGHIFNLGHGVIKHTDPAQVAALIDFVHDHRPAQPVAETLRA